jgi:hypothetical protein
MRHPDRPDLQALWDAYEQARRDANRDHAGTPSKRPAYRAYLDACERERETKKAYYQAVSKS